MKLTSILTVTFLMLVACDNSAQVGENTFIYGKKVYRIIDNEITELGNLATDNISKSEVLNSVLRDFEKYEMDFVRAGVYTNLSAIYRGDILYFKMELHALNDLRKKYSRGGLTINLVDEYGFRIYEIHVQLSDLIRIVGTDGSTKHFEFNGKTQMSSEVYKAIYTYSVSSSLDKSSKYSW